MRCMTFLPRPRRRALVVVAIAAALLAFTRGGAAVAMNTSAGPLPAVFSVSPNFMPGSGYQPSGFADPAITITGQGFETYDGMQQFVQTVDFGTGVVSTVCSGPPDSDCFTVDSDSEITVYPPLSSPPDHVHVIVWTSGTECPGPMECPSAATANDYFTFTMFDHMDTLDASGGLHGVSSSDPAGGADLYGLARSLALVPGVPSEGYVLDGWGGIHPFGGAPPVANWTAYLKPNDTARSITLNPCVTGGPGYTPGGY
ncbi:MAG: hypothetical protein JOY68_03915, partial [Candidatus Dormibacteraeota bacterium]|nr:hypothetical protein [Candidatus Dormibacteraeota bacterium]